MNKILTIIAIIILLIAGYYIFSSGSQNSSLEIDKETELPGNVSQPAQEGENINEQEQSIQQVSEQNAQEEGESSGDTAQPAVHKIVYTDNGYSPSEITINMGDTVVFENQSGGGMWTASAIHPSHTAYDGTSLQEHCQNSQNNVFDACKSYQNGEQWGFTFGKKGSFGFHNHVAPFHLGKVIVE